MKRNSMIKAIIITFLAYVVLSWIIPGGTFSSGVFTKGTTAPIGIGDIFIYPISTSITSIFVLTGLIVLLIGGLYGVMNKTGVYTKIVEGTAKKFEGKEKAFLVITVLLFAILASLTTLTLPLIVMVPFFVAVILTLGFNKMTALLSTIGAILVGNMGTIFGYNVGGYNYISYFFGLKTTENIAYKVALFVLLLIVLLIFVIKTSKLSKVESKKGRKTKKEETKEEIVIPLYQKGEVSKKSSLPLIIILVLTMIVLLVAMFNWAGALGVEKTIFDTWYTKITEIKFNGYPLFANLIGSINPFGFWTNYEFAMMLIIVIIVIGVVYNLKVKETYEAFANGMKEMLPVAAVAILANILLLVVNSVSTTFFTTIFNFFFGMSKGLNFATMSLISAIGSIGYSDFPYLMNALYDPITNLYTETYPTAVFIMQAMYGFAMLLVPTSVGLVIGLEYLNISYKEWFKQNWRLLLSLLLTALVVIIVMMLIV
ncbi:MAG: hypothetical protein J6K23_06660 [Bacilli bacterium]|nr:hypothetical protein [Bacilli bacterium]MBP3445598.1 hypothetical protein [Bacilli bacterium]